MLKRLGVLISFAEGERAVLDGLHPEWDVLLDSGAFTNFTSGKDLITLDMYRKLLEEHGSKFWHYMNLDKIGDPKVSADNLEHLRAAGLRPVPVFQRGAPLDALREMGERSELVAIGGIAGSIRRSHRLEYVRSVRRVAASLKIPVHLLGIGALPVLSAARPFSADSSDYAQCNRWGNLHLWDARTRKFVIIQSPRKPRGAPQFVAIDRARAQLLHTYGATLSDVAKREYWTVHHEGWGAMWLSICSFIRYAEHLHKIGVKYFISMVMGDLPRLRLAWDRYRSGHTGAGAPETEGEVVATS